MSTTTLNTKFQLRRDLEENWLRADPVLADGEPVLALVGETYKMKIGDGESHFSELAYYGGSEAGSDADWNTLLNKPFYEKQVAEKIITVDYTKNLVPNTEEMIAIKQISSEVYSAEEIKQFTFSYDVLSHGSIETVTNAKATDENMEVEPVSTSVVFEETLFISTSTPGLTLDFGTLPEAGTYALYLGNAEDGIRLNSFIIPAHTELKKIDKKYINYNWENIENKPFGEISLEDWEIRIPENPDPEDIVVMEQENSVQNWKITRLGNALSDEDFNALSQGLCKSQILTTENNNISSEFNTAYLQHSLDENSNEYYSMNYGNANGNANAQLVNYINTNYLKGDNGNVFTTTQNGLYLLQTNSYDYNTDISIEIKPIAFYASQEDYDNENSSYVIDYSNANLIYNYEKTPDVSFFIWASDKCLTKEDFYKSKVHYYQEQWNNDQKEIQNMDISPAMIEREDFSVLYETPVNGINTVIINDEMGILFAQEDNLSFKGMTFPKAGAYLTKHIRYVSINGTEEQGIFYVEFFRSNAKEIKTIDKQFLQIPWDHVSDPPFGETHIYELEFHGPYNYDNLQNISNKISLNNIGISNIEYYKIGDFTSLDNLTLTSSYISVESCDDYNENGGIKNENSYSFLSRKIKNSEFQDIMQDGSIFFLTISNTSWNETSPMDGIPIIVITTIENANFSGVIFPESGIYGAHVWKETTGYDDDNNEVTITKHQWIYEWKIDGEDVIKTIDSKYLSGISYPSLSQSPVTFGYIPYDDYQNVQTISLNEWNSNESISDDYYYTKIANVDFNLNETELFSAMVDYGSTQDQNSVNSNGNNYILRDNFEIYTELLSTQNDSERSYATIYYGFQPDNTTSYADFIYVKVDTNSVWYNGNIYYNINNSSNYFWFSDNKSTLYLLRHITEENGSTTYSGIYQLGKGNNGEYIKKLSPRLLPSFIKSQNNINVSWNNLIDKPASIESESSLETRIQEVVNAMFENGNGGSF